jgi:hypothetical protein
MKPTLRTVPLDVLVLDGNNANKGTKRGRALLEKSLESYGAGRSVVVDRKNRVIAGNKTVEAARAAGMQSITVVETDGSSLVAVQRGDLDLKKDKKARELAIADNRVSEIDLEWNPEVLASLAVDLEQFWNENELNALLKGFRTTELSAPEPKIDQAAELQKKWKTKQGQIWRIGNHRLMCGDSASTTDVSALMNGKTARLCATDPPIWSPTMQRTIPRRASLTARTRTGRVGTLTSPKASRWGPSTKPFYDKPWRCARTMRLSTFGTPRSAKWKSRRQCASAGYWFTSRSFGSRTSPF